MKRIKDEIEINFRLIKQHQYSLDHSVKYCLHGSSWVIDLMPHIWCMVVLFRMNASDSPNTGTGNCAIHEMASMVRIS